MWSAVTLATFVVCTVQGRSCSGRQDERCADTGTYHFISGLTCRWTNKTRTVSCDSKYDFGRLLNQCEVNDPVTLQVGPQTVEMTSQELCSSSNASSCLYLQYRFGHIGQSQLYVLMETEAESYMLLSVSASDFSWHSAAVETHSLSKYKIKIGADRGEELFISSVHLKDVFYTNQPCIPPDVDISSSGSDNVTALEKPEGSNAVLAVFLNFLWTMAVALSILIGCLCTAGFVPRICRSKGQQRS